MRQIHRIGAEKGIKGLKGKIAGTSRKRASSLRYDPIPVRLAGIGGILPSWLNHPVHDSFRHSARIVGKALLPPAQSRRIPRLDQHSGKASPSASSLHVCPAIHTVYETKRRVFATRCPLPWWLMINRTVATDKKNVLGSSAFTGRELSKKRRNFY